MVNVEADVLAGAFLAKEAKSAGVVYSMAYGDRALTAEIVDWARAMAFMWLLPVKVLNIFPNIINRHLKQYGIIMD